MNASYIGYVVNDSLINEKNGFNYSYKGILKNSGVIYYDSAIVQNPSTLRYLLVKPLLYKCSENNQEVIGELPYYAVNMTGLKGKDIMEKDKDILKQVGRDTGMRVPDGYFESFTSRMVSQLDNFEVVEPEKPTVWQRVRPWLYMAAMFAGIALMVRLFVPEKRSSSVVAETEVSITNENVEDYLFYSNVDEYSVYEYLALGE